MLRTEHHEGALLQLTGHLEGQVLHRGGVDVHRNNAGDDLHAVDVFGLLDETRFELRHALAHGLFHLFAQFGIVGNGLLDRCAHVLGIVEERRYALDDFLHEVDALFGGFAGEGLNAANAGGDTAFAHDAEQTEATGAGGVRAAAELDAVAKLHDAHFVAVLLTEEGHSAHFLGFFDVDVAMVLQGQVFADARVDQAFHLAQLLGRDFLEVGEVETQTVGRDERAFLFDVVAEDFAQGLIHEVRGGVVGFGATTAVDINAGHEFG